MSQPKIGMHHKDVRERVKRITETNTGNDKLQGNLVKSLIGQAEKYEKGAGQDIVREMTENTLRGVERNYKTRGNYKIGLEFCKQCHKVIEYCECKREEDNG